MTPHDTRGRARAVLARGLPPRSPRSRVTREADLWQKISVRCECNRSPIRASIASRCNASSPARRFSSFPAFRRPSRRRSTHGWWGSRSCCSCERPGRSAAFASSLSRRPARCLRGGVGRRCLSAIVSTGLRKARARRSSVRPKAAPAFRPSWPPRRSHWSRAGCCAIRAPCGACSSRQRQLRPSRRCSRSRSSQGSTRCAGRRPVQWQGRSGPSRRSGIRFISARCWSWCCR